MSRDLVLAYLNAMEARELEKARSMLAPGFTMTFPSKRQFTDLESLIAWSKGRYRFVRKTYDGFDESSRDGITTVYCFGTLNGEALDGKPIANVRFIDRFEVKGGKIIDQQVWNDLAEFI
jgi:hypothetical protein